MFGFLLSPIALQQYNAIFTTKKTNRNLCCRAQKKTLGLFISASQCQATPPHRRPLQTLVWHHKKQDHFESLAISNANTSSDYTIWCFKKKTLLVCEQHQWHCI